MVLSLPGPDQSPVVEQVVSVLQVDLLVPYSQVLLDPQAELPDSCLCLGTKASQNRWFIFSEAEEVRRTRTELSALLQVRADTLLCSGSGLSAAGFNPVGTLRRTFRTLFLSWFFLQNPENVPEPRGAPQLLPPSVISSWEAEESRDATGGYPAHIISSSSSSAPPLPSDMASADPGLLSLLFLTHRHLWLLRMDFTQLSSSWCRLLRLALGSVLLHPRESDADIRDGTNSTSCPDPQHRLRFVPELCTRRSCSLRFLRD